ncbi:hypothetical protein ACH4HG_38250 [Streptomyces coeruleorubidus]|uniref:Uncharacterized protein n=1 Tax=Streptomyces coeruleorubidus TaxID=116188 RepID=A0ABZ0KNQ9_STRC4|nr:MULTISPECIES: hypothetical protein [Streptomyces]WOT39573.1 hypothetical protein R5U08_38010 [Streptomyces coeruleorubidus]
MTLAKEAALDKAMAARQVRTVTGIRRARPLQVLGAHRLQVSMVSSPSC